MAVFLNTHALIIGAVSLTAGASIAHHANYPAGLCVGGLMALCDLSLRGWTSTRFSPRRKLDKIWYASVIPRAGGHLFFVPFWFLGLLTLLFTTHR